MDVSKWVCGNRRGTLNPIPEPIDERNDENFATLVQKLQDAEIDTRSVGQLNWPLVDVIYTLAIPGCLAENVWHKLRTLSVETGYFPVIVADEDELDGIVENISCHLEYDKDNNNWAPRRHSYSSSDILIEENDRVGLLIKNLKALEGASEPLDVDGNGIVKPALDDLVLAGEKMNMDEWLKIKTALNLDHDADSPDDTLPFDVVPDDNLHALHTWDPELGTRSLETVFILLVKADYGWEVPAKLLYGGWNDCPVPQAHVGMAKRWFREYDAEIISIGRASLEMLVGKPPATRDAALKLAVEQYVYCRDSVEQGAGTIQGLAAELLNGRVWHFWWD